MLPGMDEALIGMSAGESKDFTAPLAGGDREGEDAECTVTVQAVKVRELPALDDEFAQLASEFDTLEELRADVARQAEQSKKYEQGIQARDKVLEHLLETVDVAVPEGIVEAEVHQHLEGENRLDDDEHRAEVQESTRRALKAQFLLDAIAEKLEVRVEQPELIEYLVMSASSTAWTRTPSRRRSTSRVRSPRSCRRSPAARVWPPCSTRLSSPTRPAP
jgi:trigger factor